MIMALKLRGVLLATTLLVAGAPAIARGSSPEPESEEPIAAQDPDPRAEPDGETENLSVESAAPKVVKLPKSDTLWAFGSSDTADIVNSQTFAFPAQGATVNAGATGTAEANMRGLGPARTLVLVNGRRLQAGDPRAPFADLNFVPRAMIKRFDYLTGGASAVYGSDAISGIVNFIIDTNFDGLRIDAQAGTFMHDSDASSRILNADAARGYRPPHGMSTNGGAQEITAAYGHRFNYGMAHVTAYASYRKQAPVPQSSRDYSFCSLAARTAAQGAGTPPRDFNCNASTVSAAGTFLTNVGTFQVAGNQFVPGSVPFNFAPYNFSQRPDERYSLGAFADYEISPAAKPYIEAMFMDDRTSSRSAPSGDFFNTTTINCDNPLLSAQQFNTVCVPNNTFVDGQGVTRAIAYVGRRNVEGGGREDHQRHKAWRVVGGIRGEPLSGLTYDVYYQHGTTRLTEVVRNEISADRLQLALDAVANPAIGGVPGVAAGAPVCRIRLTDPASPAGQNCVPWNIFQTGGVTPEALAFLELPLRLKGRTKQTLVDANVTFLGGDYGIKVPGADNGIAINVGAEYRKELLATRPDEAFQLGEGAFQSSPIQPVHGDFDVREVFTEAQIPVLSRGLVNQLVLSLTYRYSDYQAGGHHFDTDAYKASFEFAPVPDVRARGSYNRAIRAPNIVELFTPQSIGIGGSSDPCAGAAPVATSAQCANTGVTPAQYGSILANPANQYNALFGGNPNLTPEIADTYTIGLVLQPRWIPGLAVTVDYFDIDVAHVVSRQGFQTVMAQCLATGAPFFCSKIHRAPGTGSLWLSPTGFVDVANANAGGLKTSGVDVIANYDRLIGRARFSLHYASTFLRSLEVDTGIEPLDGNGDGKFDCAGLYGNACAGFLTGAPSPTYRHRLRLGLTFAGDIGLLAQWRHLSSVRNDGLSHDCDINPGPSCTASVAPANRRIGAQNYFDLNLGARIADRFNFRLGANNLFDRRPPIVGSEVATAPFGNGNTFPQLYDALGRYLYAGVTIDFEAL